MSKEQLIEEAMISIFADAEIDAARWCDESVAKSALSVFVRCEPPEPIMRDELGKPCAWKAKLNTAVRSLVDTDEDLELVDALFSGIENAMESLDAAGLNAELANTGVTVDGVMLAQGESGMDKVDDVEWHLRMSSADIYFQYVKPEEEPTT